MVPSFQGWQLKLSVTRYFNPLFNYFFTFETPLLIVTYTLLVEPSNRRRRRRSFVSFGLSSDLERVSRTQTVSEFNHEFPPKMVKKQPPIFQVAVISLFPPSRFPSSSSSSSSSSFFFSSLFFSSSSFYCMVRHIQTTFATLL